MKSLVITLCLLFMNQMYAGVTVIETDNYTDISKMIESEIGQEDLVVFDIDDTLLHIPNCLESAGENVPKWRLWFTIAYNCPAFITEEVVYDVFDYLNAKGIDHMALTARKASMNDLTLSQLGLAGLNFYGKPFTEKDNFSDLMTKKTALIFDGGVSHASGLAKGRMLKYFVDEKFVLLY